MTQPPREMEDPSADQQELLDQLLREGLAVVDDDSGGAAAVERFRKLLEVLFSACVLRPPEQLGDTELERTHLTLSILTRQTAQRPELVNAVSPSSTSAAHAQPFYAFLVSRLIAAAALNEACDPPRLELVEALTAAAVYVLGALARDLSDSEESFMHGPPRVTHVLAQLVQYAQESLSAKTTPLLGYADVASLPDLLPQMFALHVVLQADAQFAGHVQVAAAHALSDLARRVAVAGSARQARYAAIVAAAVRRVQAPHALSRACTAIARWPELRDDDRWQAAVENFLRVAETHGDASLRRDIWRALQPPPHLSDFPSYELDTKVGRAATMFLLDPVPPHITRTLIRKSLPESLLQHWASCVTSAHPELRERIGQCTALPAPTSRKRKRPTNAVEERALAILRTKAPELKIDCLDDLTSALTNLDPPTALKLLSANPTILCALCQCDDVHKPLPKQLQSVFLKDGGEGLQDDYTLMRALGILYHHSNTVDIRGTRWSKAIDRAWAAMSAPDRRIRLAAGNVLSATWLDSVSPADDPASKGSDEEMAKLEGRIRPLLRGKHFVQETAVLLLGDLGQNMDDRHLCVVLELLLKQLGSPSSPMRSLAYTQLVEIASHRGKQPYSLFAPYLERIGVLLAECLVPQPQVVGEAMQFIGYTRQSFFSLHAVRKEVIPALVIRQNRAALETLASILGQHVGVLVIDDSATILAKVFLTPQSTDSALDFLASLLSEALNSRSGASLTLAKYIRSSRLPLIVAIVIELGDSRDEVRDLATDALHAVKRHDPDGSGDDSDLGLYLKPYMLGVLSALTEQLATLLTRADSRRKIIRSFGELIALVGDSMASFSPQIIASLQSTLDEPELRLQTLYTWHRFVELLRFADVGPFIGPTIAALIAGWPSFTDQERSVTKSIVQHIAENAVHLKAFRDDIVRFDHIPELSPYCKVLLKYRSSWSTKMYLDRLIKRTDSKNVAIATASVRELRRLLDDSQGEVMRLARGDTFDPIVGRLVYSLLGAVTRDGDCQQLRDISYECFGVLGALDPDRLVTSSEETSMMIMSNFTDNEESIQFAMHLLRDLLAGAYRATVDPRHQKMVSYSIQELLKFCGFTSSLVDRHSGSVALKTRQRWESLPKDVLETVTPLLNSQYTTVNKVKATKFDYPIYSHMKTYREWLQVWTVDLINRVEGMGIDERSNAQKIFGAFNSEPYNQDTAVARHLLPHLVLHALLSGSHSVLRQVKGEIDAILRDQVSPNKDSGPDKRMNSAQVIFNLMDHLSKWLRLARADGTRQSHTRHVESLLEGIDTELAANAALKSHAYARSLQNFEQRILQLRQDTQRTNADLQTYFEGLHEIYAALDEPDGMEGVSTQVVSPSLELQIREHESTGRWTSAQSCWEVRLQQSPDNLNYHIGLLKCLKNLGHYDTLRTHIRGVLSAKPEWHNELAPFHAEAAWTIGDWKTVESITNPPAIAKVFLAIKRGGDVSEALTLARREVGASITSREYSRSYDSVLQLHLLHEVENIHRLDAELQSAKSTMSTQNANAVNRRKVDGLIAVLGERFDATLPSFRAREEILSRRRAAFSLAQLSRLRAELGQAWIQSAKTARKAGYEQTAYSAALQARETDAPFAFIQQAKLTRLHGGILKALRELDQPVEDLIRVSEAADNGVIDLTEGGTRDGKTEEDFRRHRSLAKAVLLAARWLHESERAEVNDVLKRFKQATALGSTLEAPFFHLGRHYDTMAHTATDAAQIANFNYFTCLNYHEALQRGVKYIYQTMPRLLTVWLDLAETYAKGTSNDKVQQRIDAITRLMDKRGRILTYQYLTAFPQMISRIQHPSKDVQNVLIKLVYRVIRDYPSQALWPMVGAMLSRREGRRATADIILKKAATPHDRELPQRIEDAHRFADLLLKFSEEKPPKGVREASAAKYFPYLKGAFPTQMILPLQDALTVTLPTAGSALAGHNAFPDEPVVIKGMDDRVDIMPSLQMPKKLVFIGMDGKRYPFLCKPHDDLRKDARLMDMNSMINKFLKSTSESRRRHLYIRTYAVMSLNEECGLIEWVSHTNALKGILEKGYQRQKKKVYTAEIYTTLDTARKSDKTGAALKAAFEHKVIPMFCPTVFHEWFLLNWPEPSAWLTSRTNYGRTLAVMSMIGFVLGLGDRHGDNILFDGLSGDTVHVDLNCLFDKAKTFDVPERVPFRLTHNMVDALGVTGVEGVFRKAAEITMDILRSNGDSLMSVLEAFVHDPLVEWTKSHHRGGGTSAAKGAAEVRAYADRNLQPIAKKLRGVVGETEQTVPNQVDALIKEATSTSNLSRMYIGWAPWL